MMRCAIILACLAAAACAEAPPHTSTSASARAGAPSPIAAVARECPTPTEVLFTPPPPVPGFVPRPPSGATLAIPRRLQAAHPDYPSAARRCREQGEVTITYCVSPEGQVENVQVVTSSGFARLDNAMLAWAARDRFVPATVNGQPRRYCGLVATEEFELGRANDSSQAL